MPSIDFADIHAIQDFPALVKYLRTALGWRGGRGAGR